MASTYYSSKYDPKSTTRNVKTDTKEPYGYTTKKSYGGYNPTMRSTATHNNDWFKEVYANQFGANKDNFEHYERDRGITNDYLNQGGDNTRESAFELMMDYGLGKANDTDRKGYGEQTYNKDYQDLFNNDYSVNGHRPSMKSNAVSDNDWIADVYRNQFGISNNDGDKNIQKEQDYLVKIMNDAGWDRQQAFNWMMQNSGKDILGADGNVLYGAKNVGTMYDRDLSDAEKQQLMSENNLSAFGGYAFNPDDNLRGDSFRNNMYNKGGQYLNEEQRLLNTTEQTRIDDLAIATSDKRFDELTGKYDTKFADLSSQYDTGLSDVKSDYTKELEAARATWQTDLGTQSKALEDFKAEVAAEKQDVLDQEEAASAEKATRIKEEQEQNNRNIAGRLNQQTNRTSDYMIYLQKNNKPMYERIMQSLQSSNPELYQSIMDISGAAA